MSYAALLIIFIAIGLTSYYAFKKDLLSPTVITCCMFAFSVLLAIIGLSSWNKITELSPYTIGLMAVGVLAFFAGEILVRKFIKRKEGRPYKMHPIVVKRWKVIFSILFVAITLVLLYFEVKRICSYYGFDSNSLSELLAFYRTKSSLFSTALATDGTDINFIVKQMKKISDVICIIFMYIVANNILMGDKAKRIALYCIPIILSLIVTFFGSGGRSLMMHMIIGFFMMFLLLFRYKRQNKSIPKKYFAYLLLTAVATLLLFYLIAPLIGRGSRSNPLEYISFYLGTPIPSFEHFLSNIPSHRPYFGYETFSGIYTNLYKLGIVDTLEIGSHEWFAGSNVYTSFRSYYFDFGIIGVILCQFIFGACIAALYTNVKDLKHKGLFIIYGFFSYILIDQIRDEQFFSLLISSNVIYIILIILFYWLYVRSNIANADEYWNNKVKNPVIIIGGNHHNALGVIRSLGEKGIRPYAILTNDDKYAFVAKSKYLEGADIIREDETAIMNLLAEKYAGKDEKPILIPTSDFAAYCIDCKS